MNQAVRSWAGWGKLVSVLALGAGSFGCDSGERSTFADDGAGASSNASGGNGAGSGGTATAGNAPGGSAGSGSAPGDSLAAKYADYFPIGAAVGSWHLDSLGQVLEQDFNHLTCE